MLSAKELIKEPFAVINADDYYGKEAFVKVHDYLVKEQPRQEETLSICMAGFILGNTLSDNGSVTRGVCQVDKDSHLVKVTETHNIVKTEDGAGVLQEDGSILPLDAESYVSMNMWGLTPEFLEVLEAGFVEFLSELTPEDSKKEYLLPTIVDGLIREKRAEVTLLETRDTWFGVTYKEDKQTVVDAFAELIRKGIYKEKLFDN